MTATLGIQVARFTGLTAQDGPEGVFQVAAEAERAGFDQLFVMDHFYQVPHAGGPDLPMLEAYTLLGALAGRTDTIDLGTLVTGVTYRNPGLLAQVVTTLDHLSHGRAILGLGAGWYEEEHQSLGFDFPSTRQRLRLLEDAVQIAKAMFAESPASHAGQLASVASAVNNPPPTRPGGPPVLIGGTGERHTLRIAGHHADIVNINAGFAELPRKIAALEGHLADAGRSRDDISVSTLALVIPGHDDQAAEERLGDLVRRRGGDPAMLNDPAMRAQVTARMLVGGPDTIRDQAAELLAAADVTPEAAAVVADLHALELLSRELRLQAGGDLPQGMGDLRVPLRRRFADADR